MNTALLSARDSEAKAKFEYVANALQGDVSGDMVRSRSTPQSYGRKDENFWRNA